MEAPAGYVCMVQPIKQHIYIDESHLKNLPIHSHIVQNVCVICVQNVCSLDGTVPDPLLPSNMRLNKTDSTFCFMETRSCREERTEISARREQLGWSSCDSWTENFSANFQGGLAILCQLTQLSSLLMVEYHVALFGNRNSMLKFPQPSLHAFPLAFQ